MNVIPNVVDHLVDTFFDGVQKKFVGWTGWPQSTVQQCKSTNSFTHVRQREILAKSDSEGLGITPADFHPARLAQYQTEGAAQEAVA